MEYEEVRRIVSRNISKHRRKAGLSKKQVAQRTGINYSKYCRIENNKTYAPKLTTLILIAEALGMKYEQIIEGWE